MKNVKKIVALAKRWLRVVNKIKRYISFLIRIWHIINMFNDVLEFVLNLVRSC